MPSDFSLFYFLQNREQTNALTFLDSSLLDLLPFNHLLLEELFTPSDALLKGIDKYILEWPGPFNPFFVEDPPGTGNINDSLRKQVGKVASEAVSFADALRKIIYWSRKLGETVTQQDALAWQAHFHLVISEAVSLQDLVLVKTFFKRLKELASQVDALSQKGVSKVLSDVLQLQDLLPVKEVSTQLPGDALSLADQVMASALRELVLEEVLGLLDDVRKRVRLVLADVLAAPTDESQRGAGKKLSDSLPALAESPVLREVGKFLREVSTRVVDVRPVFELNKVVANSLGLSDETRRKVNWLRSFSELLDLQDSIQKAYSKFLSEDLTLDSLLEIQWQIQRRFGEALALSSGLLAQAEFNRYLSELLTANENWKKTTGKILVESLNLDETFQRRVRFLREMGDVAPSPGDSVLKSPGKHTGDVVQIASGAFVFSVGKALGELASIADIPVTKELFKQLFDLLSTHDGLRKALGKNLEESLTLSEFTERVVPLLKQLAETLALADEVTPLRLAFAVSFALILLDSRTRFEPIDYDPLAQLDEKTRFEPVGDEFGPAS